MAGSLIERALGLLELLASDARGLPLQQLADRLDIPKSAAHRMLAELIRLGYVRQDHDTSRYRLSTRLAALGFRFRFQRGGRSGPAGARRARPGDRRTGAPGVIEGDRQTWIAKSQGATSGLRYDPDMGREAPLFYTASGHAWLASLSDKAALALVERQGVGAARDFGPNAPRSRSELLRYLKRAREHGYAWQIECSAPGMAAMAALVRHPEDGRALGVLSVAGPSARFGEARMHELAPLLLAAAQDLSHASQASELFR